MNDYSDTLRQASPGTRVRLCAEWEKQWGVQLTWPHAATDWAPYLDDITHTYIIMAREIARREHLLVVTPHPDDVRRQLEMGGVEMGNVIIHCCPTNDTWARDHGFLTLSDGTLLDFQFNGWGKKFEAALDNAINGTLCPRPPYHISSEKDFVLEGGSIESDGRGTVFTTSTCLLAPNRNQPLSRQEIEDQLKRRLHADRIVWLDHGHLEGDDTDGHIDTLVRIAPNDTLLYVATDDTSDIHYSDLKAMETQLGDLRTKEGKPYRLCPLPLPQPIVVDGERLPATYANYLIINGAVLVPTYGQPDNDQKAIDTIAKVFPEREVVPIDNRTIILQHGSIHCCTMQFPLIS